MTSSRRERQKTSPLTFSLSDWFDNVGSDKYQLVANWFSCSIESRSVEGDSSTKRWLISKWARWVNWFQRTISSMTHIVIEKEKEEERLVTDLFRLLDPQTELEIISYRVPQILFCARGPPNTPLSCCWAFTTSRVTTSTVQPTSHPNDVGKVQQELLYQCQVFRCDIPEAVSRHSSLQLGSRSII